MYIIYLLQNKYYNYSFIGSKKIRSINYNEENEIDRIKKALHDEAIKRQNNFIFKSQEFNYPLKSKVINEIGIENFNINILEKLDTNDIQIINYKKKEFIYQLKPNLNY